MKPTNWSGHILKHPLIGCWYKWLQAPVGWVLPVGKVQSVRTDGARTMLHFATWLEWVPLDECEKW